MRLPAQPNPTPLLPLQEAAEVKPACGAGTGALLPAGGVPRAPVSDAPPPPRRGIEEGGATVPHAIPV